MLSSSSGQYPDLIIQKEENLDNKTSAEEFYKNDKKICDTLMIIFDDLSKDGIYNTYSAAKSVKHSKTSTKKSPRKKLNLFL